MTPELQKKMEANELRMSLADAPKSIRDYVEAQQSWIASLEAHARDADRMYKELETELAAAQAEIAHWKNNHETEVRRARILKERTDMPIERVQAYEKWGEDQRTLSAAQAQIKELKTQQHTVELSRVFWDGDKLMGVMK